MNRRSFLKYAGLVTVAGMFHQRHVMPPIIANSEIAQPRSHKERGFCECCEYGSSIPYIGTWQEHGELTLRVLHKNAKKLLPPNTYYEIRLAIPRLESVGYRVKKMAAWYRYPDMVQRLGTLREPKFDKSGGYIFIGGYLA